MNHFIFVNKEKEVVFLTFFCARNSLRGNTMSRSSICPQNSRKIRQMEGECSRRDKQGEEISAVNSSEF